MVHCTYNECFDEQIDADAPFSGHLEDQTAGNGYQNVIGVGASFALPLESRGPQRTVSVRGDSFTFRKIAHKVIMGLICIRLTIFWVLWDLRFHFKMMSHSDHIRFEKFYDETGL
ncbi:hypothetical protein HAX54_015950 [Datura stramonium]|uniref:Uncharacterized protein n=1 Tax=Datura stramonium TaxID=4076 RepID=A0ABS8UI37_DATST|nr:hypothetical protein [Datura stramonium]